MEEKICIACNAAFWVLDEDKEFYTRFAPVLDGRSHEIPSPQRCPECRQQRRAAWRNERSLYAAECHHCKQRIVSIYSPDKPYTVFCQSCWWGSDWDAAQYSRPFVQGESFFEQYRRLQLIVPRMALYDLNSENDSYCNHSANNKNCYMGVDIGSSEECLYGTWVLDSRKCIDCHQIRQCDSCYECSYCRNCFQSAFCEFSEKLSDCRHCFECRNCDSCLGCVQVHNKRFYVLNKQVTRERFAAIVEQLKSSAEDYARFLEAYWRLRAQAVRRFSRQLRCEESSGDNLSHCKNAQHCFDCSELEDSKYMFDLGNNKHSMDCFEHGWLVPSELNYECHAGMSGYRMLFCNVCSYGSSLLYSDHCFNNCSHLFGCIGLKKAQHCILNKQYSPQDYEVLAAKIIEQMKRDGEWGEFFPLALSPFRYNESVAQDYYPLTAEQARAREIPWSDFKAPTPKVSKTIAAKDLPLRASAAKNELISAAVICEQSGKPFRITKQELNFYRELDLPLPKRHPEQRHYARIHGLPKRQLFEQSCSSCATTVQSTTPLEANTSTLCEHCYQTALF